MKKLHFLTLVLLCRFSTYAFAHDGVIVYNEGKIESNNLSEQYPHSLQIPFSKPFLFLDTALYQVVTFSILKKQAIRTSILLPGLGDKKVRKTPKRIWMGIVGYGALAGGFIAQSKSNSYLNTYNISRKQTEITYNRNNTNKFNSLSTALWGISGLMWTIDIGGLISLKK